MKLAVEHIVLKAHNKALKTPDNYKGIFRDELLVRLQDLYKIDLRSGLKDQFETGIWETEKRWSQYEGKRISTGKFLKETSNFCEFFFLKVQKGILK